MVLVLDLSKPTALWNTAEKLIQAAQNQVEQSYSLKKQKIGESKSSKQQNQALRTLPKDHPVRDHFKIMFYSKPCPPSILTIDCGILTGQRAY